MGWGSPNGTMMMRNRKKKASGRNEMKKRTGMMVQYNTISSPELSARLTAVRKYCARTITSSLSVLIPSRITSRKCHTVSAKPRRRPRDGRSFGGLDANAATWRSDRALRPGPGAAPTRRIAQSRRRRHQLLVERGVHRHAYQRQRKDDQLEQR
jgi:hypothetical protein